MLPVRDNGTDTNFVRFIQDAPISSGTSVGVPVSTMEAFPVSVGVPQSGDDLRDYSPVSLIEEPVLMNGYGPTVASAGLGIGIAFAGRALRLILGGGGGRLTAATWNSLPSLVRTALTQVGIGVGAMIAFNGDIPFITLPGQGDGTDTIVPVIGPSPLLPVMPGSSPLEAVGVVGSWVANGVTFYRLADGKLAVQNKKGRWKVWRPKKPIVLYADGASNLKTMLRADKALNKQAKKIAAMLNRRAPRTRKTSQKPGIIIESGPGNVITR
jgi:hypothetical protein